MHDGSAGWLVSGGWMLALWLVVAVATVALARGGSRGAGGPAEPERPDSLRLLDERYAHGEIDAVEYQQRKEALRQPR